MDAEAAIGFAFLVALALVNVLATGVVLRDPDTERRQKLAQLLALWLFPVFGAILVFALHRSPEPPTGTYRQSSDPPYDDVTTASGISRAIDSSPAETHPPEGVHDQ